VTVIILAAVLNSFFEYLNKNIPSSIFVDRIINKYEDKIDISKYDIENSAKNPIAVEHFCSEDRVIFGENYTNKPVIILGCSYAFGFGLKKEKSFPFLLSEKTKRPVINFAECGYGAAASMSKLINFYSAASEKYKKMINDAEYIVYLYMYDHSARYISLWHFLDFYPVIYETSEFEKKFLKYYLYRYIASKIKLHHILKGFPFSDNSSEFILYLLKRVWALSKLYAPEAEFITIIYDETLPSNDSKTKIMFTGEKMNDQKIWGGGSAAGFSEYSKIVHTKELTGFIFNNKYRLNGDQHPNESVWSMFTPLFAEKYIK